MACLRSAGQSGHVEEAAAVEIDVGLVRAAFVGGDCAGVVVGCLVVRVSGFLEGGLLSCLYGLDDGVVQVETVEAVALDKSPMLVIKQRFLLLCRFL